MGPYRHYLAQTLDVSPYSKERKVTYAKTSGAWNSSVSKWSDMFQQTPEANLAQEKREAAAEKAEAVIAELHRKCVNKAAVLVEVHVGETLTYYAFPNCHWIKLRTNNPLQRIMREISRRASVFGAFPVGQSCLNLAAARLRLIVGTQWSTRKCMTMAVLRAGQFNNHEAGLAWPTCER